MSKPTTERRSDALVANTIALVLGTAAFSVSFTHVMRVAAEHGQPGWVSKAIAVSVELLAVASVAEVKRRRSRGEAVWIAIVVLLLGVAMSLATNLATAAPGFWGGLMAAWPAVSFLAVAVLVESRTHRPSEDSGKAEEQSRTNDTPRTDQALEIRTEPVRTPAPAPYAARTDQALEIRTEPVRAAEPVRTQPAPAEPVRAQTTLAEPTGTDEVVPAAAEPVAPADAQQNEAEPVTDAVPAEVGLAPVEDEGPAEPQDARPVVQAPAEPVTPQPATAPVSPAVTALSSRDIRDTAVSDSVLLGASRGSDAPAPAPALVDGYLPGAGGLLVPSAYAAKRPELIVPGRPAPAPGPRPVAPATPRTGSAKSRTPHRSSTARTGGAARTDKVIPAPRTERTDAPGTERPARTDVVAELVSAIRTDAGWRPDYDALKARTGYQRSFLEKCVSDARKTVAAA